MLRCRRGKYGISISAFFTLLKNSADRIRVRFKRIAYRFPHACKIKIDFPRIRNHINVLQQLKHETADSIFYLHNHMKGSILLPVYSFLKQS
jgi:hypothetical protein